MAAIGASVVAIGMLAHVRCSAVHKAELRPRLDVLLAALKRASLATSMRLAVFGATNGTLLAVFVAASPAAAVTYAEIGLTDSTLTTTVD